MDVAIWFGAMVFFGIVEAATVTLVSVWFAGGALVAMFAALFGAPVWLQVILFVAASAALLASLRPLVRRYVKPRITATNADALVGQTAVVTETIANLDARGAVKINGVVWSARSSSGDGIPAGVHVRVDRIEGVKLFVTPADVTANI